MRVVCATEWIVFLAKVIYENTKIKVRINNRFMDEFPANTSVHHGSGSLWYWEHFHLNLEQDTPGSFCMWEI